MTKIAGRYEIKAKLGEGGMGVVYRAYDPPPMDREVAVKTLHAFEDPLALELFYKEGSALKTMSHPNIVEIFDMGVSEIDGHQQPFFVMPLLLGQTLDELIRKASHRLTVDRVVEIFMQTCRGLQAAHERGLVHRDLKPSNIFVMTDDSVKIIDFGVAHTAHAKSRTTGYDKGTLLYMSPEQVQHKPVSVQSDVYALGVTLYEALTRRQPFRNATEEAVIQAILTHIPPPATDLNPAVSHTVSRVVHKAMAKQPWNRFDSARDFGETLQKAHRNEPIAAFDASRLQPRIQTALKALEKGDYQFAGEIISELEAEGNIDPQITLLRAEIDQSARKKTVAQLLESARARYEEEEDPLALQKLQEVLQMDPTNVIALGLKSKIEDRRSERQIEKWIQLAQQHASNRAYSYAREALQNALTLRPKDPRASRLLKEIEGDEQEYMRLRHEKAELYQAAVNAWKNGEISQALSQMKVVLDLDRRAPDVSSPDAASTYQSFFNKIRSEHEAMNHGYAEARRLLADREYDKALAICQTFLEKYPGQALFRAVKFDVDEQQRQRLSAFIAETDRRLQAEADLDARVHLVREAAAEFPAEDHFKRLVRLVEDKRDLVNSIVERAKLHENSGQIAEALSDFETLRTVYAAYPGLKFEQERLQKRLGQQTRDAARTKWVRQIDAQLHTGDYARANGLLDKADAEFPGDPEMAELRKLASQGVERSHRADQLVAEAQALCEQGHFHEGIALLKAALQLDDRSAVRMKLRDLLVGRAQQIHAADWRAAEGLIEEALELDPNHALGRSLRSQVLDQRREEEVSQFASQARRLQADGEIAAAMAEVEKGLAAYPTDTRLGAIKDALNKETVRVAPAPAHVSPTTPGGAVPIVPGQPVESVEAVEKTQMVPVRASAEASGAAVDGKTEIIPRGGRGEEPAPRGAERPAVAATVAAKKKNTTAGRPWWMWPAAATVILAVVGLAWAFIPRNPPPPPPVEDARLVLTNLPAGVEVFEESTRLGAVNESGGADIRLSPGNHQLRFELKGYSPVLVSRDFVAGQPLELNSATLSFTALPATTATLRISGLPEGTLVSLDGQNLTTLGADGGFESTNLPPGENRALRFERAGFLPVDLTRSFAAGQTLEIIKEDVRFRPAAAPPTDATLLATDLPSGTVVFVNSERMGTVSGTQPFSVPVKPGSGSITIQNDKCNPIRPIDRTFKRGEVLVLSTGDFDPCVPKSTPPPPPPPPPRPTGIDFRLSDAPVEVTLQDGAAQRRVTTSGPVQLPAGKYRVVENRRWTGEHTTDITIGAGEMRPFPATALDLDWFSGRWTTAGTWLRHDGGANGFNTYDRPGVNGTYAFTVKLRGVKDAADPVWIVGDTDRGVYRRFELRGNGRVRRSIVSSGKEGQRQEGQGRYASEGLVYIRVEVSGDTIVHQACPEKCDGANWVQLDKWTVSPDELRVINAQGLRPRFAFAVPSKKGLEIAHFTFTPPGR